MKRSEMINIIIEDSDLTWDEVDELLNLVEKFGMRPPGIEAKFIRPGNYPWGVGCTMHCRCDECDPNFFMNEWENE